MRITPTQDAPPPKKAKQTFTPPPPRDGDDITDVLSQVEPFAKGAMKAYGFWALLRMLWRRVVPFCAVILMVLCIAMCGLTVFMIFLFQRGV